MVRDLGLRRQVGWCVIVGWYELGVFVFVELIRAGLQHTLLKFNTPLELHIAKSTERHEEAEQPVLMSDRKKKMF